MARRGTITLYQSDREHINNGHPIKIGTFSGTRSFIRCRSLKESDRSGWQNNLFELIVGNEKVIVSAADLKIALDAL